jgi:hypothetical protein
MCFKVLAAQLTPAMCLGALQLCLESKEQWTQLRGQGQALFERACQLFAEQTTKATDAALSINTGQRKEDGNTTLAFSLAKCDINFFEALFDASILKDAISCSAFYSLLLAWHRLRNPGATAAQLLSWLSSQVNEKSSDTFIWFANAQEFSNLISGRRMYSPNFDVYGQNFYMHLTKDDEGQGSLPSTKSGLYLMPQAAMPGWEFGWTFLIEGTSYLPKIEGTIKPYAFIDGSGYGYPSFCPTAHLLHGAQGPTYVLDDAIKVIKITITVTSTSLVRLGSAFLTDNFEMLVEDDYFSTISGSMMMAVLPLDSLRVSSELSLLKALLKWNGSGTTLPARRNAQIY